MTRNLKALGLALVAVLAMGAVMASAASASFDSEIEKTTIEGEQPAESKHKFTVEAGSTECSTAKFHSLSSTTTTGPVTGTLSGSVYTSASLTIEPIYDNCTNSLLGEVNVKENGCHYRFTAGETISSTTTAGSVHVECHEGKVIEVVRASGFNPCTIKVGPQTLGGIVYHNEGSGSTRDVLVTANVEGLKYSQSGLLCPGGTGNFENGTYKGDVTTIGTDEAGNHVGVWVT